MLTDLKEILFRFYVYLTVLAFGLAGGWLLLANYTSADVTIAQTMDGRNEGLIEKNKHVRYIRDLAAEFSMDPVVVSLVDRYSRKYLQSGGSEWRLVQTPEFLTHIMLSLIYTESKGDPSAIGDKGKARGLTQIWVTTAQDYGDVTPKQLLDPETNLAFSFKHFHRLLKKYSGNLALALYAWNRGDTKIDKLIAIGERPENEYGKKVYYAAEINKSRVGDQDMAGN